MKVTVVATEPVEVQVRVEDGDPGVNTRGLVMLGIAGEKYWANRSIPKLAPAQGPHEMPWLRPTSFIIGY